MISFQANFERLSEHKIQVSTGLNQRAKKSPQGVYENSKYTDDNTALGWRLD